MDVREKLVELLKSDLQHFQNDVKYWHDEHIGELADHLIAHGVTVQDNTEINDELLELLRNAPLTVMTEEPTVEVVQEWISVKDRLPDKSGVVIGFDTQKGIGCYYYHYSLLYSDWKRITHWMPLPQPPKGE